MQFEVVAISIFIDAVYFGLFLPCLIILLPEKESSDPAVQRVTRFNKN